MSIEAGLQRYETINSLIKKELSEKSKAVVKNVNGQRYIGCTLDKGKLLKFTEHPAMIWHAILTAAK